ncbi:putative component of NuA3 histone acetyltransferase complex [Sporothrix epigloea]|uniref:Component of NuA3 histone acetyltransferase complex n=1 Tax=Sporothrix epigloea TaxID=1892477 RepID=A0ABP0DTS1_9PEZI
MPSTKRKAEAPAGKPSAKRAKRVVSLETAKQRFRKGLFDTATLDKYTTEYAESEPYKHAVIDGLVNDALLRSVRDEIRENVSFSPKETDIYKIHQSGDLANLDGLEDAALAKLPSLLSLRDALYSESFRNYVSHITGCGPLSGRKTDMAINVYTPGCYLLCHDDVIGSRKVSYILYLTDPDIPWQSEWGGALRLFPVAEKTGADGEVAKTPGPDPVKVIPPAWNQLSFFAVQPGESFHDVEEVYHAASAKELKRNGGRVRMAISGWFHIPQPGEDGFVQGAEEAQLKNSGLMQLQGNPDQHDRPLPKTVTVHSDEAAEDEASREFSESDLEFLLKYLAPSYLTPDTLSGIAEHFDENSSITLSSILKASFAERLRKDVEKREKKAAGAATLEADKSDWHVARPPHKHRFLYLQQGDAPKDSPWHELVDVLLPSKQFRTWLQMATSTVVSSFDITARRFRRGKDYTLATDYKGEARLELNLGLTPTQGWGDNDGEDDSDGDEEEDEQEEEEEEVKSIGKGKANAKNGKTEKKHKNGKAAPGADKKDGGEKEDDAEVGGHEVYMAGDDDGTEDAAIYRSNNDDDNILFFQAAAWNKMTIVLRDSGTLRFVKYINRKAPGDRWDVSATFEIEDEESDDGSGDEEQENGVAGPSSMAPLDGSSSEEEFRGFSSSEDSDSD